VIVVAPPEIRPSVEPVAPEPSCTIPEAGDVTADLALDDARRSGCYAAAVRTLLARAGDVRKEWSEAQRAAFDDQVAALREAVDAADEGKPRHRAYRSMVRYLQNALVRDEVVALASGGVP
jgi:hypothetical protein